MEPPCIGHHRENPPGNGAFALDLSTGTIHDHVLVIDPQSARECTVKFPYFNLNSGDLYFYCLQCLFENIGQYLGESLKD